MSNDKYMKNKVKRYSSIEEIMSCKQKKIQEKEISKTKEDTLKKIRMSPPPIEKMRD